MRTFTPRLSLAGGHNGKGTMGKQTCRMRVKGGGRCGGELLPGHRYCAKHVPATVKKKLREQTTYCVGPTVFDGEHKVGSKQYDAYLTSPEWVAKAQAEKEKNPNCSICNRRGVLNVHHRTYVRCGCEKEGDLVVLCRDCHELFHKHYKYDGRVGVFIPA